jgi:rhodanese-related sulfurtransferase
MMRYFNRRALVPVLGALTAAIAGLAAQLSGRKVTATQWIEPKALAAAINEKHDLAVVDVRNPEEFSGPTGHIPGARNIPVELLAAAPSALGLPAERSIVMVCLTDKRSERAAKALRAASFGPVFVLRGGMQRWNAERRPVEQATAKA